MKNTIKGENEKSVTAQEEHFKNPRQLAEAIKKLIDKGAQNVSLNPMVILLVIGFKKRI